MLESQLTDDEAKEFHSGFMMMTAGYVVIALIAHFLVWIWRPWFGPPDSWAMLDKAQEVAGTIIPYIA